MSKVTESWDKNNHGSDIFLSTHWLPVPGICMILLKCYHFHFQMRRPRLEAMNRPV